MSNQQIPQQPQNAPYQYQYQQYQQPPVPPKPSKLKRFGIPVGLLLVGLTIGGVSGASAVPEPVVQVQEKRVEVPVEKIVKETPASCLTAIQHAESIIDSSGRVISVMADMFAAAAELDAAEIERLSPKIDDETAILDEIRPKYQSARDDCQSSR